MEILISWLSSLTETTLCASTSMTNQELFSTWSETPYQVRLERHLHCSHCLYRFLRPVFVIRYFGQRRDYWRQENPTWWCHQHILLPLWHHPLDSGGEAGGEHRVHHSVPGRRKDQAVVVCAIVSERSQVSGSSTSVSLCPYFITMKPNVIPLSSLSSLAWIFCWLRIVAWRWR